MVGKLQFNEVDRELSKMLVSPGRAYWITIVLLALGVIYAYVVVWSYQIANGLGVAGYRPPVLWGAYLVNFVFWIGIAHSGTLVSAILFLFRARWRTSISRSAEAMTIFAVMIAGLFPIIHLGRPWIFYWLIPYPNQRYLWPDFTSPVVFDFLAVSTYFTASLLFWYTGLVPDLATMRESAAGLRRKIYGFFSLGWSGTDRQWRHYSAAYLLLAALATPLVISVHSVVSWDFALAMIPGYHSTIFPPYFVAGAIHSGLAMVLMLLVPSRRIFRLESVITTDTLEKIGKTSILMALIVGYAYIVEPFIAWYSGNIFEKQTFLFRAVGYYAPLFWVMCFCNVAAPFVFFIKKARRTPAVLFVVAILINVGMWLERFVIIVGSMARDYLPYNWGNYWPNWVDWSLTFGSFCLFFLLFLLFVRFVPAIGITEVKEETGAPMRRKEAAARA
ncbi:MAG: putative hydrogenase 2 b cytochrome subunit [Syntrophorhabdaceae bacterium PtaU1.Bin034]|nr:MAG: putative hydrogenase 2 b cytochrome subunit [Syntrophorhabdaceae bacterium PtaU1.Bin034]